MLSNTLLTILYRDDSLVAIAKPPGVLVHRTPIAGDNRALLQELRNQIGCHVYPLHRLDRAASGVLLFALSPEDAALGQRALAAPDTVKEYLALTRGSTPAAWTCEHPLKDDRGNARPAVTHFEKLAEFSRASLVIARPVTGRRHQIRRHLSHARHQILGDTSYGKGRINHYLREHYGLTRLFLHARRIALTHPRATAATPRLVITAPLADDLRAFLTRLPDVPAGLVAEL